MNLGPLEILVILVVALMVFGPKRLPEVGRQVGGALREIRKVQDTVRSEITAVINAQPEDAPAGRALSAQHREEPDHDEQSDTGTDSEAKGPAPDASGPEPGFDESPGSFS